MKTNSFYADVNPDNGQKQTARKSWHETLGSFTSSHISSSSFLHLYIYKACKSSLIKLHLYYICLPLRLVFRYLMATSCIGLFYTMPVMPIPIFIAFTRRKKENIKYLIDVCVIGDKVPLASLFQFFFFSFSFFHVLITLLKFYLPFYKIYDTVSCLTKQADLNVF